MRVSDGFRTFVLDQLSGVNALRTKSMFGGIGLYSNEAFFGIVASDTLYFKVDDSNRSQYEAAGSRPFCPFKDRPMSMSYYIVPVHILEAAPTLVEWARRSIAIAVAGKQSPRSRPANAATRSGKS